MAYAGTAAYNFSCCDPDARNSQMVKTFARTGFRRDLVNYPHFVDARGSDIVVTEHDSHRVQIFDKYTHECRFNPYGEKGFYRNQLLRPNGVIVTQLPRAQVIVSDTGNKRICVLGIKTTQHGYGYLEQSTCWGQQDFEEPMGLEFDAKRNILFVVDRAKRRVTMHDIRNGRLMSQCSQKLPLVKPIDIALSPTAQIFVTDSGDNKVVVYNTNGDYLFHFGQDILNHPWGICFDCDNNVIIADHCNDRILLFSQAGKLIREIATCVKRPKGVSPTIHDNVVVTCEDPLGFLKIFNYRNLQFEHFRR